MTNQYKSDLEAIIWSKQRLQIQSNLKIELDKLMSSNSFSFIPFTESDKIQLSGDGWPRNKWDDILYIQTEISEPDKIETILRSYLNLNTNINSYIFFLNYNSGLVSISNEILNKKWKELIDLDGDEIFIYIPGASDFICIEKTESVIVGKEHEHIQWVYEITFSNAEIKKRILF